MQITIKREMKELEGETASHTDGEVIIVFDLRSDSALLTKRTARELVNRFQKLRKKAGLLATDTVELFYAPRAAPKGSFFFKNF
jgi:isoleucyl-tRNA synthetase